MSVDYSKGKSQKMQNSRRRPIPSFVAVLDNAAGGMVGMRLDDGLPLHICLFGKTFIFLQVYVRYITKAAEYLIVLVEKTPGFVEVYTAGIFQTRWRRWLANAVLHDA